MDSKSEDNKDNKKEKYVCNFCSKELNTKAGLIQHQKTVKKCLKLQGKNEEDGLSECPNCKKKVSIRSYKRHKKSCDLKKESSSKIKKSSKEKDKEINELKESVEKYKKELEEKKNINDNLKLELMKCINIIEEEERKNKKLKNMYVELYISYILRYRSEINKENGIDDTEDNNIYIRDTDSKDEN